MKRLWRTYARWRNERRDRMRVVSLDGRVTVINRPIPPRRWEPGKDE